MLENVANFAHRFAEKGEAEITVRCRKAEMGEKGPFLFLISNDNHLGN